MPVAADPDAILMGFLDLVAQRNLSLYPAQEEALLELMAGKHVILGTPTGSGKSLVAEALHYKGLAEGRRSFYTCPIKALVSEKFFALCAAFGAERVGMLTGDASINRDAPIICCTAEILANLALREGAAAALDYVVMDEFHYYSDRDRGVAWQLPLLLLPQCTFLLMSATLGDTRAVEASLQQLSPRPVVAIRHAERPVPLDYHYAETPLHETLGELLRSGRTPVYVVHFTQRDSVEQAQNAMSMEICSREEKQAVQAALHGFRFDTPFGRDVRRFIGHGVGLHHAGLLPKYRMLVEKLAQGGLLRVIMGTDTLGVGVNVPIRTVLFTKLCKFDGEKTALLSVRDFRQIAGRAGRKGFDAAGSVVAQAPEHVIENQLLLGRAAGNPAKLRKLVRKKPPAKGYVPWDASTFARLSTAPPEPLQSRFAVSHALVLALAQSAVRERGGGYGRLVRLIAACHDSAVLKRRHRRHAAVLFRSLRQAGVLRLVRSRTQATRVVVHSELQDDFSLHHSLSLYLLDTLPKLDRTAPDYALDVLALVEAILENPQVVLRAQLDRLRSERMAELRAAGAEYDERIAELDKVDYPKPLGEFIYATYNEYAAKHPWVGESNIRPKGIAREMVESWASFSEYVRDYGLQRSEGVLLRYLAQVAKALAQTVPAAAREPGLEDIAAFLRAAVAQVDRSLVSAWEEMLAPPEAAAGAPPPAPRGPPPPDANPRSFRLRLRTELHRLVRALARQDWEEAALCVQQPPDDPCPPERLAALMAPFFAEYRSLRTDPSTRQPDLTQVVALAPRRYRVSQVLCDPEGAHDWAIAGTVDLTSLAADAYDAPIVAIAHIGR